MTSPRGSRIPTTSPVLHVGEDIKDCGSANFYYGQLLLIAEREGMAWFSTLWEPPKQRIPEEERRSYVRSERPNFLLLNICSGTSSRACVPRRLWTFALNSLLAYFL